MSKVFSEIGSCYMSRNNKAVYEALVGLEIAALECEELSLEVLKVEWGLGHLPRLVLQHNAKTKQMMLSGKARQYGSTSKGGKRFDLYQMQVRGVKCVWEAEQEPVNFSHRKH